MTRVYIIAEGSTEESFLNDVVAPVLWPSDVYLFPIQLGRLGHRGGRVNYARVKKDVVTQLSQDRKAYCSTMFDFYGLGAGFPGMPCPAHLSNQEKVAHVELAMASDFNAEVPDLRPDLRFIPYLQLHEYEGLLFSDPVSFATAIRQPHLAAQFEQIRQEVATPEDIKTILVARHRSA